VPLKAPRLDAGEIPSVRFGLSTHLFHDQLLGPTQLTEIARHGFLLVELFATRTHFDYHDASAIRQLRQSLTAAGLFLHSVHAPIVDGIVNGVWGRTYSTATTDATLRQATVREIEAALAIAQEVPYEFLVVHLGVPTERGPSPQDNSLDAARRSISQIHDVATKHGVRLALEVIPNRISTVESLIQLSDEELELPDIGICLDYGHAFLMGDLADTIEAASGHMVTTHIHDNPGKTDAHLVPFEGRIDWSTAVMTTQKVGYEGVWLMELANTGNTAAVLRNAQQAARRLESFLVMQE
jgi:sugar phosphate isomerase/epimerase